MVPRPLFMTYLLTYIILTVGVVGHVILLKRIRPEKIESKNYLLRFGYDFFFKNVHF